MIFVYKKTQLSDLNDLEVSDRFNIVPLFCALVLKKENELTYIAQTKHSLLYTSDAADE